MKLILSLFVILWILSTCYIPLEAQIEGFTNGNYFYKRCATRDLGKILGEVFKKHGINKKDSPEFCRDEECSQWNIYLPCGYTGVELELGKMDPTQTKLVFGIPGCDKIVSKNNLWKLLVKVYGRAGASKLSPVTYLTHNPKDIRQLVEDYSSENTYILKKNLQRQTGLKLSNDISEILSLIEQDPAYTVVQEMLKQPLCINGHKINLRVYVIIVCYRGKIEGYRYLDGFNYYTPKEYRENSIEDARQITSGYVPRELYEKNPLTHRDLSKYLGNRAQILFNGIDRMLAESFEAFSQEFGQSQKFFDNKSFQLFGIDVAPDIHLQSKLIEINKGPDMSGKDERDKELKFKLQEDIFNLLGVLHYDEPGRKNQFKLFIKI